MITIGVFDSGFGGLTVLRELLPLIPGARYLYLGDTARLPYGAKSQATIARYAVESARFLEERGAQMLVIACNTATALALEDIRAAVKVPVVGVIEPGAMAAWESIVGRGAGEISDPKHFVMPMNNEVLVLATQATVSSHAYLGACKELGLRAVEKACPLLVPLVEEGWIDHPVTREVLSIYLNEAIGDGDPPVVLLGCTHYPLIRDVIVDTLRAMGRYCRVVDSAQSTAHAVFLLARKIFGQSTGEEATFACFATDSVEKFRLLGTRFLGREMPAVELIDLGG